MYYLECTHHLSNQNTTFKYPSRTALFYTIHQYSKVEVMADPETSIDTFVQSIDTMFQNWPNLKELDVTTFYRPTIMNYQKIMGDEDFRTYKMKDFPVKINCVKLLENYYIINGKGVLLYDRHILLRDSTNTYYYSILDEQNCFTNLDLNLISNRKITKLKCKISLEYLDKFIEQITPYAGNISTLEIEISGDTTGYVNKKLVSYFPKLRKIKVYDIDEVNYVDGLPNHIMVSTKWNSDWRFNCGLLGNSKPTITSKTKYVLLDYDKLCTFIQIYHYPSTTSDFRFENVTKGISIYGSHLTLENLKFCASNIRHYILCRYHAFKFVLQDITIKDTAILDDIFLNQDDFSITKLILNICMSGDIDICQFLNWLATNQPNVIFNPNKWLRRISIIYDLTVLIQGDAHSCSDVKINELHQSIHMMIPVIFSKHYHIYHFTDNPIASTIKMIRRGINSETD